MTTEGPLNGQEATPGHCQSCWSFHQGEASCSISPFLCNPNSSLAFLSLLSGLPKMNSEEGMSELISCNYLALQNFLTARNFWTIVHDDSALHFLWKPKGCTIAPGWKRRAGPAESPASWCKPCLKHMQCLLQMCVWVRITGYSSEEVSTGFQFQMQIACNYRCIETGKVMALFHLNMLNIGVTYRWAGKLWVWKDCQILLN